MEIRVVSAPAQEGGGGASVQPQNALFVPAGAILSGVLLHGLDAPTGQGARKDPTPALLRSETLTCVRTDRGVIEVPLDA